MRRDRSKSCSKPTSGVRWKTCVRSLHLAVRKGTYEEVDHEKLKLPKRQKPHGYAEPAYRPYKRLPQVY